MVPSLVASLNFNRRSKAFRSKQILGLQAIRNRFTVKHLDMLLGRLQVALLLITPPRTLQTEWEVSKVQLISRMHDKKVARFREAKLD